jgi:regulator of RNase E activity RraA
MKGVQGTVVDGAVRDIEAFEAMGYPVYAKGAVPRTARGRLIQDAINIRIRFCNTQVNPGDVVFADRNGIVFIPPDKVLEVVEEAEKLHQKEEVMIEQIKAGKDPIEVSSKGGYETMLKK